MFSKKNILKDNFVRLIKEKDNFEFANWKFSVKRDDDIILVYRDDKLYCIYNKDTDMLVWMNREYEVNKDGIIVDHKNQCDIEVLSDIIDNDVNNVLKDKIIEEGICFDQKYTDYCRMIGNYISGKKIEMVKPYSIKDIKGDKTPVYINYIKNSRKTANELINSFLKDEDELLRYIFSLQTDKANQEFFNYLKNTKINFIEDRKEMFRILSGLKDDDEVEITAYLRNDKYKINGIYQFKMNVHKLQKYIIYGKFPFDLDFEKMFDVCANNPFEIIGNVNKIHIIGKDNIVLFTNNHLDYDDTLVKNNFSRKPEFVPQSELDMIREIYSAILK